MKTLQETIEIMTLRPGNGDIASGPYEIGFMIDDECKIIVEGDPDRSYPFQSVDFYGKKWQIIKAKKEMVSAEDIINIISNKTNGLRWERTDVEYAIELSAKNRDILYGCLMEYIKEHSPFFDAQGHKEFLKMAHEIDAVLNSTSSTDSETSQYPK